MGFNSAFKGLRTVFYWPPMSVGVSPTVLSDDGDWSCPQNDGFYTYFKQGSLDKPKY